MRFTLLLCCLAVSHGWVRVDAGRDDPAFLDKVLDKVRPIVRAAAHYYEVGLSLGVATDRGVVGAAGGLDSQKAGTKLRVESKIPMGSATKLYTATASRVVTTHNATTAAGWKKQMCALRDSSGQEVQFGHTGGEAGWLLQQCWLGSSRSHTRPRCRLCSGCRSRECSTSTPPPTPS